MSANRLALFAALSSAFDGAAVGGWIAGGGGGGGPAPAGAEGAPLTEVSSFPCTSKREGEIQRHVIGEEMALFVDGYSTAKTMAHP